MHICDAHGPAICCNCNGTPPSINGYSHGNICRKTVQNIMNYLEEGDLYRYKNGKLYLVEIYNPSSMLEEECEI